MKFSNRSTGVLLAPMLSVLLAAVPALPAWAQQEDRRATALEEVIVTAQKREERLQDTPISAVAFDEEDLQSLGANELAVAVNYVPNVIVRKQTASNSNYAFGFRGVTSGETSLTADPVIGLYVDGVYLGRTTGAALDLGDVERMEVLRGPQGSLYGRNVVGGAINMVPRKPSDKFEFSQSVSTGEYDYTRTQTILNTPMFGNNASIRINYMRDERGGILDRRGYANTDTIRNVLSEQLLFEDEKPGERLSEAWRMSLKFNPQPGMRVYYSYEKNDRDATPSLTQIKNVDVLGANYLALLRLPGSQGAGPGGAYSAAEVSCRIPGSGGTCVADTGLRPDQQKQQELVGVGTHFVTRLGPYVGAFPILVDGNVVGYQPAPGAVSNIYPIYDQATSIAEPDDRLDFVSQFYGSQEHSNTDGHVLNLEWDVSDNAVLKSLSSFRTWDGGVQSIDGGATGTDFGSFQVSPGDSVRLLEINALQDDIAEGPDADGNPLTLNVAPGEWVSLFRAGRTSDHQQFTQELQLLGESFNKRFRYAMGLYYFEEEANEDNRQFTSYPGVSLPLVGGVASAFDFATSAEGIGGNNVLRPAFAGAAAQAGLAGLDFSTLSGAQLVGLMRAYNRPELINPAFADNPAGAMAAVLSQWTSAEGLFVNGLNLQGALTGILQSALQVGEGGAAQIPLFQGLGSGSLCGDPDGATYGVTDLSLAFGLSGPGQLTVANACLDKTLLAGSPIFQYGTDNSAVAAYAQGDWSVSDRANVALGLRYTIDRRAAYLRYSQIDVDGDGVFGEIEDTVRASEEWDKGTYDITLNYRWLDDFSTFFKVATGYRAGGYNGRAPNAATFQKPVNAEELITYELGWKFEGLGRTLRINGAIFKTDYEENQTSQFSPSLAGATSIITNAGDRRMEGAELELTWLPIAGLTWNFNVGYLDAYWDFYPLRGISGNPHDPNAVVPYSPELSWSTILEYQLPPLFGVDIGNWSWRLEAQYQDAFTISPAVAPDGPGGAPERTIVNTRLTLSEVRLGDGGSMSFSLWGKNITDEEYQEFPIPFLTFNIASFGDPASAGIDFRYDY